MVKKKLYSKNLLRKKLRAIYYYGTKSMHEELQKRKAPVETGAVYQN